MINWYKKNLNSKCLIHLLKNVEFVITKIHTYLNLGNQPPSNSFVKFSNQKKKFSPKVQICEKCGLSQLDTVVSPKNIFKTTFIYHLHQSVGRTL